MEEIISMLHDEQFKGKTFRDHIFDIAACQSRPVSIDFVSECKEMYM